MKPEKFILIILLGLFIFLLPVFADAACNYHNVWGWAWSENIGWISFSCANTMALGTGVDYGVDICTDNSAVDPAACSTKSLGDMVGYTWAGGGEDASGIPTSTIGWINFAPAEDIVAYPGCGYPISPCYSAKASTITGEVSGWARACAVFQVGCSGALKPDSERGGWDGWIKLREDTSSYGVWLDTSVPGPTEFRDWAWGGDDSTSTAVIGWISFNCVDRGVCGTSNYKVITGFSAPPTAAMECEIPIYGPGNTGCRGPGCVCAPGLWETFNGSEAIFNVNNNSSDPDGIIVSSIWSILPPRDPWLTCPPFDGPLCDMGRMPGISTSTYDIRLVVEDDAGITGTTSNPIKIKEDTDADFECSLNGLDFYGCEDPTNIAPLTGQTVYFMSTSKPSEGATQIINWYWEKGENKVGAVFEPFGLASSTVTTTLTAATNTVRLTVWDDQPGDADYPGGGRTDSEEKTLDVSLPLPEYREVAPTGWLDNFLARLSNVIRF